MRPQILLGMTSTEDKAEAISVHGTSKFYRMHGIIGTSDYLPSSSIFVSTIPVLLYDQQIVVTPETEYGHCWTPAYQSLLVAVYTTCWKVNTERSIHQFNVTALARPHGSRQEICCEEVRTHIKSMWNSFLDASMDGLPPC